METVGLKLPIGFRFRPTDEELLVHYLRRKVFSIPLPALVIPDHFDVFLTHPSLLPGELREKRYFFSKRKGNGRKKCYRVTTTSGSGCGYWKVIGKEKQIVATTTTTNSGSNQEVIGIKKRMVFYQSKQRTCWFMNEFRLLSQKCMEEREDWVVCSIYQNQKKRKAKTRGVVKAPPQAQVNSNSTNSDNTTSGKNMMMMMMMSPVVVMDFMMMMMEQEEEEEEEEDSTSNDLGPPQPSSSSSFEDFSSSHGSDQEASSSTSHLCFPF